MRNYRSLLAILLIGIIYVISIFQYKPYDMMEVLEGGDAFGYNVYLPALFIHHDLADLHATMAAKYRHSAPHKKVEGDFTNKYFAGTAVLQAPFFFIGHIVAGWVHEERDGFSFPYTLAIQLSAVIYVLWGLFILMLVLRRRFSDGIVTVVILILGLGTNLYFMVVRQPPFCHPYLFFWYSLLIWLTVRFYESFQRRFILLIGFVCGLIVLTRLNELYVVLIPLFWGVHSRDDLMARWRLIKENAVPIFVSGLIMILCLLPQVLYWKVAAGHFLYYSYREEKFDFLHPHIIGGLFGFGNGWLIYTPVMFLAIFGIWPAWRRRDDVCFSLLIYLTVHIYIIYSWWCWFYMGSYGSRPMTEAYPLLSITMAYVIEWFMVSWLKKGILFLIAGFCIWQVMIQTYQSSIEIFNSELSNWRYNLVTFGKTKLTYEESVVLDTKEFQPSNPIFVKALGENNFEDPDIPGSDTTVKTSGRRSVRVSNGQVCTGYTATLAEAGAKPGQWIKASINCLAKTATNHNWHLSSMVIEFTRKGRATKWSAVSLENKINNPEHRIWHFPVNEWGKVYFYSQLPPEMSSSDTIRVYVENIHGGADVYVDDLKVELYEER